MVDRFETDWNALIEHLESVYHHGNRNNHEAIISHINNLKKSLEKFGLTASDIAKNIDQSTLKMHLKKAKTKVMDLSFRDNEKSPWMNATPRKKCFKTAMRGRWDKFPVNPSQFADEMERYFIKKVLGSKKGAQSLVKSLEKHIKTIEEELCDRTTFL